MVSVDHDELEVDIIDTGIGIEEHRQSSLFIPFGEINSFEKSKDHSIGIGLAASREIVQRMGGDAFLKRSSDGLTVFSITLPVQVAEYDQEGPLQTVVMSKKMGLTDKVVAYLEVQLDYPVDQTLTAQIDEDELEINLAIQKNNKRCHSVKNLSSL